MVPQRILLTVYHLRAIGFTTVFKVGSMLPLLLIVDCVVFCMCVRLCSVSWTQCCIFFWIVHYWLPFKLSLTCIYRYRMLPVGLSNYKILCMLFLAQANSLCIKMPLRIYSYLIKYGFIWSSVMKIAQTYKIYSQASAVHLVSPSIIICVDMADIKRVVKQISGFISLILNTCINIW
jgi:hypothetical protein